MDKKELIVTALENGTVIDHIPASKLFKIVSILGLDRVDNRVTIGNNLESKRMGHKGVIKVADRFFQPEEISKIALLAPSARINIIRNYEVVQKNDLQLPDQVSDLLQCPNPMCVTNRQPVASRFDLIDRQRCLLRCHYCERTLPLAEITLK